MSSEIELIGDDDGLAIIGQQSTVDRFLRERGLLANSRKLGLEKLDGVVQTIDAEASGFGEVEESSGSWLKLTEKSAELVKEFGLMETKTRRVSHIMIGDPGESENGFRATAAPAYS
jgi:hypothetical protein